MYNLTYVTLSSGYAGLLLQAQIGTLGLDMANSSTRVALFFPGRSEIMRNRSFFGRLSPASRQYYAALDKPWSHVQVDDSCSRDVQWTHKPRRCGRL
jgi:hypothetical protein